MKTDWEIRREIMAYGKRLHDKGLIAATDGNISLRVMDDRVVITPSGAALGELTVEELVYMDLQGQVLGPRKIPSSEWPMHLEIYRQRPDVNAVVHAHPKVATGLSVSGTTLDPVLPEIIIAFGSIPTAPYATPSSTEGADAIRDLIKNHNAIILDHHGAITVGRDLQEAYQGMERVEHVAATLLAARQAGPIVPLDDVALKKLSALQGDPGY